MHAETHWGTTTLHKEVQGAHIDIVKYFIKQRADLNAINDTGTILELAVDVGDPNIVNYLIEN